MEITPGIGFSVTAISMVSCFLLNVLVDNLPIPSKYADRSQRHKWRNVVVSTIHAVSGTIGGFVSIYFAPELLEDHMNVPSSIMLLSMAISNGYYIYDFIDLARNTKLNNFLPLMMHHTASISFVSWVLVRRKLIGLIAISSCMELNGIFLHLRHILLMCGYKKDDIVFRVNNVFNVVTYFVLRLGIFAYDTLWLCWNWNDVGLFLPAMAATLLGLNIALFIRLIRSDYVKKSAKPTPHDIMAG
ncbi:TLC domain-containing protein 2-like [Lytechinus variegatus]|uniref:TLC domain-containing protein 2-like n=1 Tax=Lytechinus variegatus TaxID=7654 RepID=UPI001BB2A987|nr:TLC domain-containing protein 2-like [Lytechinus variegatus]XP_041455576.1 TLC domain-containing protein 2-like [Lytechinus variegatus]